MSAISTRLSLALVLGAISAGCQTATPEEDAIDAMRQALAAVHAGDVPRAKLAAEHAADLRPGFIDPLMFLADLAKEGGDLAEARRRWTEVLELDPTKTDAGVNIGWSYLRESRFDDAREWFMKSVAADPGCEPAVYNLGELCDQEGRLDEAAAWFEIDVVLDRRDPRGVVRLGEVRLRQNRVAEALAAAEEALRRYPQSTRGQALRARALELTKTRPPSDR